MTKLALCLSGGAARGAFHLGALAFFDEQNIKFEAFSGSSIGSIIAASYASGISPLEQLKIFKSKELKKCIKFNPYLNGLLKIDTTNPLIKELLPIAKIEDIPKPLYICVYDYKNKELIYYDKGDVVNLCIASSALIPLFKPLKFENRKLFDGGLLNNIPVEPLLNKNYKICALDLLPRKERSLQKNYNPINLVKKRIFKTWHLNIDYAIKHTDIYITTNELRETKMFTFDGLDELFKLGYKEASNHLNSFK
ncbi:patatin-like phospholipase family protein [Arcobacter sp. F2176]|jgi:NTE family protein|uniref:patatin-like phospholipase family protein n=1 Tax=Arcobacter sp. F2176 TaxID=2044511 RepID=UPI00100C25AC|nr:patatin-like phospholipase family protein [Arcobacter sp. F2176]RXJ80991.1 patatin [Arcobacter sp. F2176]